MYATYPFTYTFQERLMIIVKPSHVRFVCTHFVPDKIDDHLFLYYVDPPWILS